MENIKQMIDNLRELADKALGFRPENSLEIRLLMAEAKVAELETYNEFLENQNESLRNFVENAQKVFAALDLEEAKGCVFSEEELGAIRIDLLYIIDTCTFVEDDKVARELIVAKIDAIC